jgi:hypothetical protein
MLLKLIFVAVNVLIIYVYVIYDLKNAKRREVNTTLRTENKRILEMNMKMKEALKNGVCKSCRDSQILKELRLENEILKERVS